MQSYKDKEQCGRIALECIKEHNAWTQGLLSLEDLKEQLSTIVPRESQEKS
jgi:hypothetical protein